MPDRARVLLAGICALILTVGLARFAYTPLLPIMREQAGLSHLAGGWLATINYAGYMSGALLAASIADLRRKFVVYRVGLVVAVLSTAAMGLTDSVPVWAVLRYLAGFSSTAGLLLASGLVLNWLMRQGHRPELGLHFMGVGLGIVVSGLAVGLMAPQLAWDRQWVGLGLLGVCFFVPAWRWMPAPLDAAGRPAASPHGAAAPAAATMKAPPPGPSQRWRALFSAAYFCAGFGFVISSTFIVAILVQLPLLAGRGSWVWVIVGLAAVPSSFAWDRVAAALGPLRALMIAYVLQALATVLPVLTDSAALNVAGAVLFGATVFGIVSLTLTLIGRRFPANPAKAMARATLSYGVAQIAAPAMAGTIATATGSYHGALVITAAVMVVGVGFLQALSVEERRSSTPGSQRTA